MIELIEPGSYGGPWRFEGEQAARQAQAHYQHLSFNGARLWIYLDGERISDTALKALADKEFEENS